jgi:hypothetical protein
MCDLDAIDITIALRPWMNVPRQTAEVHQGMRKPVARQPGAITQCATC